MKLKKDDCVDEEDDVPDEADEVCDSKAEIRIHTSMLYIKSSRWY